MKDSSSKGKGGQLQPPPLGPWQALSVFQLKIFFGGGGSEPKVIIVTFYFLNPSLNKSIKKLSLFSSVENV